jgi:hypothetical protein
MPPKNYKQKSKYNVWSLHTIRQLRRNDSPINRDTGLPVRPVRYYSLWNDIKLAWLVLIRKADAFIWEDNEL